MPFPYYDCDHTLLACLSETKAALYVAAGTAVAVKTKDGRIVRLYRRASAKTYPQHGGSDQSDAGGR